MSIASQLTALEGNISNAYDMVAQRGGTVPARKNMENLDDAIATIPSGGSFIGIPKAVESGVYKTPTSSFTFSLPNGATELDAYELARAFANSGITSLDLNGVTTMGNYACQNFCQGCSNLTSVTGLNSVTTLGMNTLEYAFAGCTSLTSINLSGVSTISKRSTCASICDGCTSLASINLSNLAIVSGQNGLQYAFRNCTSLVSVSLDSLTTVSGSNGLAYAFYGCTNLTSVSLSSLTTIGAAGLGYTFYNCRSLVTLTFPSLSNINNTRCLGNLCSNCTSLTTLSFPALTPSSFGKSNTNQFNDMLSGCSNVTVHFPVAVQSTIGSWSTVRNGFGGTNTTVLFDL